MASVLAIAGAVGAAGSAVAGAAGTIGTVSTLLSVGTTIAGGISSMNQADAEAKQIELQSQRDEINSRMAALEVGDELIQTLSSNTAAAAASGIQSSGSAARAQEESNRSAQEELAVLKENRAVASEASAYNIKATKAGGKREFAGSLLSAGQTAYGAYTKVKKVK